MTAARIGLAQGVYTKPSAPPTSSPEAKPSPRVRGPNRASRDRGASRRADRPGASSTTPNTSRTAIATSRSGSSPSPTPSTTLARPTIVTVNVIDNPITMPSGRRRPPTPPADSNAGSTGSTHGDSAVPAPAPIAKTRRTIMLVPLQTCGPRFRYNRPERLGKRRPSGADCGAERGLEVGLGDRPHARGACPRVAVARHARLHGRLVADRRPLVQERVGDRARHRLEVSRGRVVCGDVRAKARALDHRPIERQPEVGDQVFAHRPVGALAVLAQRSRHCSHHVKALQRAARALAPGAAPWDGQVADE